MVIIDVLYNCLVEFSATLDKIFFLALSELEKKGLSASTQLCRTRSFHLQRPGGIRSGTERKQK